MTRISELGDRTVNVESSNERKSSFCANHFQMTIFHASIFEAYKYELGIEFQTEKTALY